MGVAEEFGETEDRLANNAAWYFHGNVYGSLRRASAPNSISTLMSRWSALSFMSHFHMLVSMNHS